MSSCFNKVYWENLPKCTNSINKVNWQKSCGLKVKFTYEEIEGELEIIKIDGQFIFIKYLDYNIHKISKNDFKNCNLEHFLLNKTTNRCNSHIGEVRINAYGSKITIIYYKNNRDITVEFDNGYIKQCRYGHFKSGKVKSPYCKSVCNIGYLGEGKYNTIENGQLTNYYEVWRSMIKRCYNNICQNKQPSYKHCIVCEEWHNFQNFAKWFEENYYEVKDSGKMHLDKDILHKGNKVYSPETCVFVPQRINELFVQCNANRGNYPIGVYYNKQNKKFTTEINGIINGKHKRIYSSSKNTPEEAFYAYKEFKEKYIKQVADEYIDRIPSKLYEAMYKWEVNIDD